MSRYPIVLDLTGRRVLVVGGGPVAARRVAGLADAEADVHVVAPEVCADIRRFPVDIQLRSYADNDLDDAWLVHACTDDEDVNAAVAAAAEDRQIPCVCADRAEAGTARTPAVARSGDVVVAVSSDDPGRSASIRNDIAALLDTGGLPARRQRRSGAGSVALVGGGPGDPGLITVRGRLLLADADVVVVDRLAPRGLLAHVDAEIVDVGKAPYRHGTTQEQINRLIVERAVAGQAVVRLKGGDPFVFGRGAEEVAACVAAGVQVSVVPGVSSVVAAPAVAGIPLTHRGVASEFTVVSAHHEPADSASTVDWKALARSRSTLVLLMAMERLEPICAALQEHGRSPETPAAVVQNASLPDQRVLVSTVDSLPSEARRRGFGSPAVVVIGEVVGCAV